jgi:hypothetical protein
MDKSSPWVMGAIGKCSIDNACKDFTGNIAAKIDKTMPIALKTYSQPVRVLVAAPKKQIDIAIETQPA